MDMKSFKDLSFKGKIKWIIDYYGLTIFFSIIALLIIFNLVNSFVNPEPIADTVVFIYCDELSSEDADKISAGIADQFDIEPEVQIYHPSDLYGQQALATKVGADQIDIIITPLGEMELMNDNAYIQGYEQIGDTDLYLGIPKRSRTSEQLLQIKEYVEKMVLEEISE